MPVHATLRDHGCAVSFLNPDAEGRAVVWIPVGAMMAKYDAVKKTGVTDEERVMYLLWVQVRACVLACCTRCYTLLLRRSGSTAGWTLGRCPWVGRYWCWT